MRTPVRRILLLVLALAPGLLPGSSLHAQIPWDGPALVSPGAPQGLSVFLVDPAPDASPGALVNWRHDTRSFGLGYRVALARDAGDDVAVSGGVDISGILAESVEETDVRVTWWTGLGAGLADELVVSVPVGLVAGWVGQGDGAMVAPYAGGHVVLDLSTQEGRAVDLDAVLDVGLDLTLASGWLVRFGASVGGRDALAIGLRVPS